MSDEKSSGLPRLPIPEEEEGRAAETRLLQPGEMLSGGRKRSPWFVAVHGARSSGRMFQVRSGMTIGRAIGSEILLDEEGVSRRHAKLKVLSTGQVLIEDLGSSNGIFFAEQRIMRRVLSDGERIRIGDVVLELLLLDDREQTGVREAIDQETRLPNRRGILEALAEILDYGRHYDARVAFCLFIVDQLRDVHDAHGAATASAILAQLAMTARNVLHDDEVFIGRFSEDEIAVVIPDMDLDQGERCAEWIRRAAEATAVRVGCDTFGVTMTGGVAATRNGEVSTPAGLVEQARCNLCRAIAAGRNRVEPAPALSTRPAHGASTSS